MKKNYLSKTAMSANPLASTVAKKSWKNITTTWLLILFTLLGFSDVFGQITQNITTSGAGTWTVPAGTTGTITVEAWGAGGSGGGAGGAAGTNDKNKGGSGGTGGTYVIRTYPAGSYTAGVTTYNLFVAGTTAGGAVGSNGNNGAASWFDNTATVYAPGGKAGNAGNGAAVAALSTGAIPTTGAVYGAGTLAGTAGNGSAGSAGANGGGAGGASVTAGNNVGVNGNSGTTIGGGGSGGAIGGGSCGCNATGGAGAQGQIRITYTVSCTGTPTAGTTSPATQNITSGNTANLAVSGYSVASGITFQWQQSASAGGPFVNVTGGTGATTANYTTASLTTTTYYRCVVTCTNGGSTANSSVAEVVVANQILVSGLGTNSVTCGTNAILKDHAGDGNYTNNRNDWSVINAGLGATITLTGTYTVENSWDFIRIYDGSGIGGTVLATYTGTGTINYTGNPGQTLTIRFTSDGTNVASGFVINVSYSGICFPACINPTAQPTALSLSPSGTSISGSFTAASPAADSYLILVSTNPVAPTAPVNSTNYPIGSTYQAGYTVVDNDTNNVFTATGLSTLTTYYFYIYSFNGLCSGGPLYLGSSPLTGSTTTLVAGYCTPSISATYQTSTTHHIRKVEFIGTLQDIVNTSSFPTVPTYGYENYTGLAIKSIQAKGEGVNIYMESPNSGYIKAWVDWNTDGDFDDAGEIVYDAGGTSQASTTLGFIVPTGIPAGDYRVRLRISGRNVASPGADAGFGWNSCSTNLAYYGETEDYILRVIENCAAKISTVTGGFVCGSGVVTLNATATPGTTEFRWYTSQTGGSYVSTTTGTWNTPSISTTTTYWVTAFNGTCETLVRTKVVATVKTVPTLSFATSNTEVCGENSIVALTAAGDTEVIHLIDEKFEGGLGVFTNSHLTNNPAVNTQTAWQTKTGPFVPTGLTWYPAIASGFGANSFAFVNSDVGQCGASCYYTINNALVSSSVNSTGFLNLTLSLRLYFDRYYVNGNNPASEYMSVDVSVNGGAWTSVSANMTSDVGYGTRFTDLSYNFTPYINVANLRIRVHYYSSTWANGAAVDDIQLFGTKALNTAFQWSGTPLPDVFTDPTATTTPYVAGTPVTTVYVKPNLAQLENGSYTFTATALLSNGCNVSQNITITNKSSIWKGTSSNDWNNPANWSPAVVPDANSCVIIPTAPSSSNIIGTNYNAFGKTLIVKNGGRLDIQPNNTLTIRDAVTVDAGGTFNIESTGSLIQVNNVANSGIISMKRNASFGALDYVYWSSPVANFTSSAISPATPTSLIWKWEPTTSTVYANQFGNWVNGNEAMTIGRGYIVRSPNGWPTANTTFTANFVGIPNNGTITRPITRWTYTSATTSLGPTATPVTANDDNWNLLGNPYPSAISAVAFLAANSTHINSFVDLWTHGNAPAALADPFYQDYQLNYNPNDYLRYNNLGGTQFGFDGKIGAGQGFFVLMRDAGATTENAIFNNSMRSNTHRNDQFYRTSDPNTVTTEIERHRIWLKMIAPNLVSTDMLLGYAAGASNNLDDTFDAMNRGVKVSYELYSLAENQGLLIQGRSLPFDANDRVPLGLAISQNGIHTLAISGTDGLFGNATQNIYLEDLVLGITHDLRTAPYTFTAAPGRYENRFVLKFNNETLGNEDFVGNNVTVYTTESININATNQTIKSVKVYDLLGRVLGTFNNVNSATFTSKNIAKTQTALLVEVVLDNGATKTYKVIF